MKSRNECSPRIIKRANIKKPIDDATKYGFYRQINHLSIMKLDNERDKLNYSSWLTRLDNENSDLKMHLIKILFISLRSDRSLRMFLKPPPDDLNDLELMSDNTMDMVKHLQDNNVPDEPITNENDREQIKHRRFAAVATDMRSYTTTKTAPYFVQSFYVRSDFPIYTWYNPTSINVPSNFDHNQWELYLNRFQILTESKNFNNKHRNRCEDIIPIDQISKEVATAFNWHPYSILGNEENRPKRTPAFIEIDLNIANQQCNQQQIDDAAFAIVYCKVFPGNKILDPKLYTITLIPDAKFIFKMTGVTLVNYSNLKSKKEEQPPSGCKLKPKKQITKKSCDDNDAAIPKQQLPPTCLKKNTIQHQQSNPDVSCSLTNFELSDKRTAEDKSRFLTSEKIVNNRPAVTRTLPSPPSPSLSQPQPPPSRPSTPSPPSPSPSTPSPPPQRTPSPPPQRTPSPPPQRTPSPPPPIPPTPTPVNDFHAPDVDWNPDVSSYSAFSDRRNTEDPSRFMTSERIVDDHSAEMCTPPSPPLPDNDYRADQTEDVSSAAASDWSVETGPERCNSSILQTSQFHRDDDYASSLSTLTSAGSSIEMQLAERRDPDPYVNYDRRMDNFTLNDSDRYPFDGRATLNTSHDFSFQDDFNRSPDEYAAADAWPPRYNLVDDVSMPGSMVIGPWSLSGNMSRSGRDVEIDNSRISDRYDTSCSESDIASEPDD
ncbi:proteoglycan 4-like isoform X1 [Aphis craccivora]|uniref:Proteoglycan 4-like isoform X1 n=1 Tax=Aphis craccivora TaxID=307492 RepID=A0A6G0YGE6_APHCR|nr:proteoglycan 4-like isoform X1 [Aphis craccivora]